MPRSLHDRAVALAIADPIPEPVTWKTPARQGHRRRSWLQRARARILSTFLRPKGIR